MGSAAVLTRKAKNRAAAGMKRGGQEIASPKASKGKVNTPTENGGDNSDTRKRPKRAASCSDFKEKSIRLSEISSSIELKEARVVKEETDAIYLTKQGPEESRPARKLLDFIFHDDSGNPRSFEMSEFDDLYITALVMPMDDDLEKEKERGVRCEGFGRIESWSISGYDEGSAVIWVSTEFADYECVKPMPSYNKFYNLFYQKAHICVEVYQKIARSRGGNPNIGVQELLACVTRSMSGSKGFPSGPAGMDFLVSLGDFIYNQIVGLEENKDGEEAEFFNLPVLVGLRDECRKREAISKAPTDMVEGSLKINEQPIQIIEEDDDMKLAKLLQEEEDWKQMKRDNRRQPISSNSFYVKINEDEIANDYPLPAYYKPTVQEADEYMFCENEDGVCHVDDLPRRILDNWALYNSDSRLVPLELLPMKSCADIDVTIYGSGYMREDDGGYSLEGNGMESSSGSSAAELKFEGIPIYLSSIKEWMIEFGSSMIFVSIRTDIAWYRLGRPLKLYSPWFEPVLRTARLAVSIISLLKDQSRISKLSFSDVTKKLSEIGKDHPAYISSNLAAVERFVVVHGQIILQQFAEFPDEKIQKCAFVSGLADMMRRRRHTRLAVKKKLFIKRGINSNPSASMIPLESRKKLMRATMTKLINRIWGSYYSNISDESKEGVDQEVAEEEPPQEEEEENEEDEEEDAVVSTEINNSSRKNSSRKTPQSIGSTKKINWEGESTGSTDSGDALYKTASIRGDIVSVGGAVIIDADEEEDPQTFVLIENMFQKPDGVKMGHGRILLRGSQTVLDNAANDRELFLSTDCVEFDLGDVKESVLLTLQRQPWGPQFRKQNADSAKIERARAEDRKKKGLPVEYFCKSFYCPQKGAFMAIPSGTTGVGNGTCYACKARETDTHEEFKLSPTKTSFTYKKIEYHVDDFVYVKPDCFEETMEADRGTFKAGRNVGLRPFVVCQILEICSKGSKSLLDSTSVKVRRFYRPDDVSAEKAYSSDIRELYYSEECSSVPVESLQGKCSVTKTNNMEISNVPVLVEHTFFCGYSYNPETGAVKQLPANAKIFSRTSKPEASKAPVKNKGKAKCGGGENEEEVTEKYLATLDIFAGCGGLSEGLERSGVSRTKWAIEYEEPAGEAFSLNHPRAKMFVNNCNVILKAIMEKCGEGDDCISTSEAGELAAKLSQEELNSLPLPGEVDFINGGPPCQGFSGMNRFSTSTWSKVQCEMILAFLSFADIFRPKFFLLENVRNFVSFNKGQTFRLTLASLLEMGYQVRFGVLEAGAYGVSQSRKRAFIWAASPEENLPEWPEPMHVFSGAELKISMPGGVSYAAVRSTAAGASFRSITVRDTIGDLPPVSNGASNLSIDYGSKPTSWFQKQIRGDINTLNDHISKEMNELNLIRCKRIPKRPGADWHDLPDEKVKLSTGQVVDLIPWCLPNTAKKHNQWKGLFGRLDWEGNFPTSITDPQPMGKVGMCFHPDQDRILTVRECARSQGFPDSYKFAGSIQNKHRQIGNAVPPPLAYALGRKLKEAVEARRKLNEEA
ncbi:DNA (cytosine-5)-methyltransferase 1B-like [Wolffia australiana]